MGVGQVEGGRCGDCGAPAVPCCHPPVSKQHAVRRVTGSAAGNRSGPAPTLPARPIAAAQRRSGRSELRVGRAASRSADRCPARWTSLPSFRPPTPTTDDRGVRIAGFAKAREQQKQKQTRTHKIVFVRPPRPFRPRPHSPTPDIFDHGPLQSHERGRECGRFPPSQVRAGQWTLHVELHAQAFDHGQAECGRLPRPPDRDPWTANGERAGWRDDA